MARPSGYQPDFPDKLYDCLKEGMLDCEIYSALGISKSSFYRYIKEYPEFKKAYEDGLPKCEAWWIAKMKERFVEGNDKGFKYCQLIMKHKFGYKDFEGGNNTQINVTNNYNLANQEDYLKLESEIKEDLVDLNILDVEFERLEDKNDSE